ncbi:2,3-bisphosphoglycerate-independent phosphoglycerate mutase, partial [Candidatus Gottesmanbacteria bacterium]|nr:2,3-bisphosphoglycerate-independent phosphoglycerate mutase [Candidatus Gottesmanbacteria bacterium]
MKPFLLLILDGWGIAPESRGNAISQAHLPYYKSLLSTYPHGVLQASGQSVGLPVGAVGNTETGHLNIGAGYIVAQDLVRINYSIANGTFFKNKAFLDAINHARKYESNLHLIGMVGAAGVHSNIEHLIALLELLKEQSFNRVFLHLMTDGRDSPPKSSLLYLDQVQSFLVSLGFGKIATVMGRYYGMDRDYRWERTRLA